MISEVVHRAGYDLSQWQSIAMLLSDARKKLSPEDYVPFYNAVTTYSRSRGTDAEALATIESVVSGWNSNAVEIARTEEAPAVESKEDTADEILAAAMQEVEPEPESTPLQKETMPREAETLVPHIPASTPIPAPEKEPQKIMTVDEAKARILVIKNEIHELIGNPVALIGDMGQLGKDYMTALLQASRATMGGSGGGVMPAMQALEDAYEKLRTSAMTGEMPEEQTQPEPVPEPTQEPEPEPEPEAVPENQFEPAVSLGPVMPAPKAPAVPHKEESPKEIVQRTVVPQRNAEVMLEKELESLKQPTLVVGKDESTNIDEPSIPEVVASTKLVEVKEQEEPELEPEPESVSTPLVSPHEQKEKEVLHDVEIEALRRQLAALELKLKERAEPIAPIEIPEASEPAHAPALVSHEEPVEHAPVVQQVKTPSAPPPQIREEVALAAPIRLKEPRPAVDIRTAFSALDHTEKEKMYQSEAVTDGLRSLLMSWEIFRGGFLSGKERGIEHPLYKTMHGVVMSDILAGKFQGAKTNVIISVNDYVNAWRFEQGVEFNPAETFEHYLRRVIHRILTRAGELT
ncbi:hypothetical protein A3C87_04115 [Candidatus Kaiserbacteria bacterium RIFCSPHIGHO2_02_FULL_49_34]|uniref:Uncharacterized protein n=1 Tax=Candidatus Kaiserbacteria bacterium RIFCSPHIGHO2_02_FULL_49_34 TaxID=1798491 RepID=A0A1F6DJZ5_9BACT|nr:MAG: hypothetical protein A3C87_04115 [Candidatus Kaiserbacteria bacterium RIFCSPHIGHO2_02_FULL_49_34]